MAATRGGYALLPQEERPGDVELTDYGPEDRGLGIDPGDEASPTVDADDVVIRPLAPDFTLDTTANQRTQWAWTRTALGMISLGLSITHIFTKQAQLLGLVFILLGAVYGVVASVRYLYFFQLADAGKFRTNSVVVSATTALTLVGLLLVLVLMYSEGRGTALGDADLGGGGGTRREL